MVLILSALLYLAISMAAVLAIDFAIGHKYRPQRQMKSRAAPAYARTASKTAATRIHL